MSSSGRTAVYLQVDEGLNGWAKKKEVEVDKESEAETRKRRGPLVWPNFYLCLFSHMDRADTRL
jgi:hypothetical protein